MQHTLRPAREIQTWPTVPGAEVEKEAKKQTSTAASIDGWSGDEVASFPSVIWDRIAMFFQDCERLGSAPEQFGFARQARIPKEGKAVRAHDGAFVLRPCPKSAVDDARWTLSKNLEAASSGKM